MREFFCVGPLLLCLVALSGCSPGPTSIDPPSGPVGTEVCFDPAPPLFETYLGETCGWFVRVGMDPAVPALYDYVGYVRDNCFEIPSWLQIVEPFPPFDFWDHDVSPGDVLKIYVAPDWGALLFGYCRQPLGIQVMNIGARVGTFTVTE